MSDLVKLNDEVITSEYLVKYLKTSEQFEEIMEKMLSDRITVHIAREQNISVSDEELQQQVDNIRRVQGLHRSKDTIEYIEAMGFTVEEFGDHIRDEILKRKMLDIVCSEDKINEFFKLNSPQYDTVDLRHIIVASEGEARELVAVLEDDPDLFEQMAIEHSLSHDTAKSGGSLGVVMRGLLAEDIEAKVFNASSGDILGPHESDDGLTYEVFKVDDRKEAELNAKTQDSISNTLKREWIKARMGEHTIEFI